MQDLYRNPKLPALPALSAMPCRAPLALPRRAPLAMPVVPRPARIAPSCTHRFNENVSFYNHAAFSGN